MEKRSSVEKLLDLIVSAAEDKKAFNPVVLDVRRSGRMTDYMVIISGDASPHLKAIAKEVESRVKASGVLGTMWEGGTGSGWMIFDLGQVLVHVMSEKMREFYDLESLWGKEAIIFHE